MRIVILGSRGLLGGVLEKEFGDAGHEVYGWDREQVDVLDEAQLRDRLSAVRAELIINCVAYNNVDKAETDDGALAEKLNGFAVGAIALIAKEMEATVVHFSTDYVFDGRRREGYDENATPSPISNYGRTKALGETELQKNTDAFYLIRTSRLFGPAGTSELSKKSFVDTMVDLAKTRNEFKLVDEEAASPTYTIDLARAVREVVEARRPFGIYHRTNDGICTWYEFGKKIFELAGLKVKCMPVPASEFPRPAKRPAYSKLISTKLPSLRPWERALTDYLATRKI